VEKDRRIRVRHRDMSSKLVIVGLDVLDSAYYQCTASNAAGSVNSTAVLRVGQALLGHGQPIASFDMAKPLPCSSHLNRKFSGI
jgi:hypothetical protein